MSLTDIFFPSFFISGASFCGGETTTFSVGLSIFMYSLKYSVAFLLLTPVAHESDGDSAMTCGGVSSYHPIGLSHLGAG